jgi:N-acetylmuramoyl-L-alanine amidase
MDGMTLAHGSVEHEYGLRLSAKHADLLRASGVSVEVAREREYVTVDTKVALKSSGSARVSRSIRPWSFQSGA